MRAPTDIPRPPQRVPRGRGSLILVGSLVVALLMSLRGMAGTYTDYLWFDELELTSV